MEPANRSFDSCIKVCFISFGGNTTNTKKQSSQPTSKSYPVLVWVLHYMRWPSVQLQLHSFLYVVITLYNKAIAENKTNKSLMMGLSWRVVCFCSQIEPASLTWLFTLPFCGLWSPRSLLKQNKNKTKQNPSIKSNAIDNPQNVKKYLQIIYMIRDLYLEYIKNSHSSTKYK